MAVRFFHRANRHYSGVFGGEKMSEDKIEKVQETKLLPVVEVDGREFLVDVENRMFRNFTNPDEVIGMHSEHGRKTIKEMQDSAWKSYGLSTGTIKKAEV